MNQPMKAAALCCLVPELCNCLAACTQTHADCCGHRGMLLVCREA